MEKQNGFTIVLLLLLVACSPKVTFQTETPVSFKVKIADSSEERSQGLMFVESMPDNEGTLFIFGEQKPLAFWMKNTLIPLDMIFIDEEKTIVEIHENVQPCHSDPCPSYPSPAAKYVVEINGGLAEKYGMTNGTKVILSE